MTISVIIPIYNQKRYLARCIDSVITQSYHNLEIILVDDGSTDGSSEICDTYARADNRIKVVHQQNSGPASARNAGLKIMTGEFVTFIDSDDYLERSALQSLVSAYRNHPADMVIGGFKNNGLRIDLLPSMLLAEPDIIEYVRLYLKKPSKHPLFAYLWGRLFKTAIIKNNKLRLNPALHTFEDVAFNFDYLCHTRTIYVVDKHIYNHTLYNDFSSAAMTINNGINHLFGYKVALNRIARFLHRRIAAKDIKQEIGHAYIYLTIVQLIRICGQIDASNRKKISSFIYRVVNDKTLQTNLKYYVPTGEDSRLLPLFIQQKGVQPLISVCSQKAIKRYGR